MMNPQTRKMPNDIMMALSICDMCLLCEWFSVSLYTLVNENKDNSDKLSGESLARFCTFEAEINIMASSG